MIHHTVFLRKWKHGIPKRFYWSRLSFHLLLRKLTCMFVNVCPLMVWCCQSRQDSVVSCFWCLVCKFIMGNQSPSSLCKTTCTEHINGITLGVCKNNFTFCANSHFRPTHLVFPEYRSFYQCGSLSVLLFPRYIINPGQRGTWQ